MNEETFEIEVECPQCGKEKYVVNSLYRDMMYIRCTKCGKAGKNLTVLSKIGGKDETGRT